MRIRSMTTMSPLRPIGSNNMKDSSSNKNLIIALVIFVAIGVAGYMYSTRDRSTSDLLIGIPTENAAVDGDLLMALNQLQTIRLDTEVFDDPVFESLSDIGTTLVEQPKGRPNPFAPIDSSAAFSSPSSVTSATTTP